MSSIIIETLMKTVYTWIKRKLDIILNKRRGEKILENFKATVWKTE